MSETPCSSDTDAASAPPSGTLTPQRALRIAALLAFLAIVWITRPVGIGVVLGMLTAFTLLPLFVRLREVRYLSSLAALICVATALLATLLALGSMGYLIIERGGILLREHLSALAPGGPVRHFFEQMNVRLPRFGIHPDRLAERIGGATTDLSMRLAGMASALARATVSTLLTLFFLLLTCYYMLQNWSALSCHAELLVPLEPRDTRALLNEFRRVGRSVLLGTVLTGIAQGVLAGLGYWMTGVPEAAFFGTLTAIASLLPGVGTLLIWVPVGIVLLLSGHVTRGIVELLWGLVVIVGCCDYLLRPQLVGRNGELPGLLTLIGLFGGLEVFGLVGLILGPVIISLAVALLRIYEREVQGRAHDECRPS
jgi:predicted PurR-regulated permease PerM